MIVFDSYERDFFLSIYLEDLFSILMWKGNSSSRGEIYYLRSVNPELVANKVYSFTLIDDEVGSCKLVSEFIIWPGSPRILTVGYN